MHHHSYTSAGSLLAQHATPAVEDDLREVPGRPCLTGEVVASHESGHEPGGRLLQQVGSRAGPARYRPEGPGAQKVRHRSAHENDEHERREAGLEADAQRVLCYLRAQLRHEVRQRDTQEDPEKRQADEGNGHGGGDRGVRRRRETLTGDVTHADVTLRGGRLWRESGAG